MSAKTTDFVTGTPDTAADWLPFVDVSDTSMAASGTDKKAHPDAFLIRPVSFPLTAFPGDDVTIGDGKSWYVVPASMNGKNLVSALAAFDTAGITNTSDFQLRRRRAGVNADMLSTKVIVVSGAFTAANGVVNLTNDDIATGDIIYLDCDAVSTTKPKGGGIVAEFQ